MSQLKKTLNECHAFFYRTQQQQQQQLIRHVKELVLTPPTPLISVPYGSVLLSGIKMVTGQKVSQHTHLKMLNLINCPANAG